MNFHPKPQALVQAARDGLGKGADLLHVLAILRILEGSPVNPEAWLSHLRKSACLASSQHLNIALTKLREFFNRIDAATGTLASEDARPVPDDAVTLLFEWADCIERQAELTSAVAPEGALAQNKARFTSLDARLGATPHLHSSLRDRATRLASLHELPVAAD